MSNVLTFPLRGGQRITTAHRVHLEQALESALDGVESLIAILDKLDGDPDREDSGDAEPSLGAPEDHPAQLVWLRGTDTDREKDITPCA